MGAQYRIHPKMKLPLGFAGSFQAHPHLPQARFVGFDGLAELFAEQFPIIWGEPSYFAETG